MKVACSFFILGNVFGYFGNFLYIFLGPGSLIQAIKTIILLISYFIQSMSSALVASCPIDELDINSFVYSRPTVCAGFGLTQVAIGFFVGPYFPVTVIAYFNAFLFFIYAFRPCCEGCRIYRMLPRVIVLLEVFCYDYLVRCMLREWPKEKVSHANTICLTVWCALSFLLQAWLWWKNVKNTIRFYAIAFVAMSFNGIFQLLEGLDLVLKYTKVAEGLELQIVLWECFVGTFCLLMPLAAVIAIGRQRFYGVVAKWLSQRRSRRLQDGAFMAMLLDSSFVQKGQPWWMPEAEVSKVSKASSSPVISTDFAEAELMPNMDQRPHFVLGSIVEISEDRQGFQVKCYAESETMQVKRIQETLPWPKLLQKAFRNLRCVDWKTQSFEIWKSSTGPGFDLSRPVGPNEVIDFFVSHSWSDDAWQKWQLLQAVADDFHGKNGRFPTLWVDKFCINQRQIADGLRLLPVNVMACRQVLVLAGPTYPTRLWCAWELCVLLSFTSLQEALNSIRVKHFHPDSLKQLAHFTCRVSRCFDPNEELRLRRVITAIGQEHFEEKIQNLGQLMLERENNTSQTLMDVHLTVAVSETDDLDADKVDSLVEEHF